MRDHMITLESVGNVWHGRKHNSIAGWLELKQGEYCGDDQGPGVEVDVTDFRRCFCSRVDGDPAMQVVKSFAK